jgi:protein-S-isoprenylcysteine O-methyltransferase Ste14
MIYITDLNLGEWIILLLFFIGIIGLSVAGICFKKKNVSLAGVSPIKNHLYNLGKLSIWSTWLVLILQSAHFNLRFTQIHLFLEYLAVLLCVFAFVIISFSYIALSDSLRVGLPKERTSLKIEGIYKFSRNPIYVAFYLLAFASVIYTLNPVVLIFAMIGSFIHHKIVLGEEIFLTEKFGEEYTNYINKVRRYI